MDRADLVGDQVEIVEEPFGGRGDRLASMHVIRDGAVDGREGAGVPIQAAKMLPAPPASRLRA